MKFARRILLGGGVFNVVMGLVFFSNALLERFFQFATWAEYAIFRHAAVLPVPQNPAHLLLIHGFGAGALILGLTLLCSASDPRRYQQFIFIDGLGRLLYGSMMVIYVFQFSLLWVILVFAVVELIFAFCYLLLSWRLGS